MKGNADVIGMLNTQLADELTAVSEYMVHAEMCDNWGYERLAKAVEKRAIDEMKHAEKLIARILFLEGKPIVNSLNPMHIGAEVKEQLENDHGAEEGAIAGYNAAIRLASDKADNGSRELFEDILEDEEDHIDWIEAQLDQIQQMGIQNYLVEQLG
jgi:bacterioferritin